MNSGLPLSVARWSCAGLAWSPDGGYLAVWDSPLEYNISFVMPADGAVVGKFRAYEVSEVWGGSDGSHAPCMRACM